MSRPTLLPGLRRLWRDPHSLQLGTDPQRAVILDFADAGLARVLDLLDGTRTERMIIKEAGALGVAEEATAVLLDVLRDAGLAIAQHTLVPSTLVEPVRRRLATEAAALALRGAPAGSPAEALRRRAGARVMISGYGRLAAPIAAALAQAGVGHVDPALEGETSLDDVALGGLLPGDAGRWRSTAAGEAVVRVAPATNLRPLRDGTATFVVQAGRYRPAELTALAYARRGVPHLSVDVRDGLAVIGPLVPPAGSPCLNCLDLYRRDRDPAWPALAAQLSTGRDALQPCAVTTALVAVGYAADEVLTFLDGGTPQTVGATIEIAGPGRERRRTWSPHPRCDCRRLRRRATKAAASSDGPPSASPHTVAEPDGSQRDEVE
jgi:bacteriocin biosynthesis cyclodehydratase domain-containing protein